MLREPLLEGRVQLGVAHRGILLDVDLELDALRRIRVLLQLRQPRAQRRAAIEAVRDRRILAPRHVAEPAAAPLDAHCVRIVRIVRLAYELERVADAQILPQRGRLAVAEARQGRTLYEQAHALRVCRNSQKRQGETKDQTHCESTRSDPLRGRPGAARRSGSWPQDAARGTAAPPPATASAWLR